MNIPTDGGRYIAVPRKWTVESKDGGAPTFVCEFDLRQYKHGGEWTDIAGDALEITGWFYIFKKDGQPNTFTIDALKESLGWDGASLASLNDSDWSATEVQLELGAEEYNGKRKMKVQFINPRDSEGGGGVKPADPQVVKSLDAKYGSMLRALGGNRPAAKPGNGRPAAAPASPADAAKKLAWAAFTEKWNEHLKDNAGDAPDRDARWKAAFVEHFGPGVEMRSAAESQWTEFAAALKADYSPAVGFIPFP